MTPEPVAHSWKDRDEEEALPFGGIGELANALGTYLATDGRKITLPHIILDRLALERLLANLRTDQVAERLIKAAARPEIGEKNALLYLIAGQLITLGIPERGPLAKQDAWLLMNRLLQATEEVETAEVLPSGILTTRLLDEAAAMLYSTVPGAVAEQLEDSFSMAALGLVIIPNRKQGDPEERGFALAGSLLQITEALKYPESAVVLQKWIFQVLSGANPEACIGLLRTMAQFSVFLDSEAYVQLYAPGKKGDIPLLPFQSFYRAVTSAKEYFQELKFKGTIGVDHYIRSLEDIEKLIILRFHQILRGPLKDAASVASTEELRPSVEDLAIMFVDWFELQRNAGKFDDLNEAASYAIKLLEQTQTDIQQFADILVAYNYHDLARIVLRQAVFYNLLLDSHEGIAKELMLDTLEHLRRNPWKDAKEHNFTEIIDPGTTHVEVYAITGTFVCTGGHRDLVERVLNYIHYLDQLDKVEDPSKHVQRIILLIPLTDVENLVGYDKDPAVVGPITNRVGSMLLHFADLPRNKVFITTTFQPQPSKAETTERAVQGTINAFIAKIQADFAKAGSHLYAEVVPWVTVGLDELIWEEKVPGRKRLTKDQPRKTHKRCLGIGRYGLLVGALESAEVITGLEDMRCVLTPGTSRTSSTASIHRLGQGEARNFLTTAVPYMVRHWSPQAIEQRKRRRRELPRKNGKRIPSVTEIQNGLVSEYAELLRKMGILLPLT